jgi:hypothetical protein
MAVNGLHSGILPAKETAMITTSHQDHLAECAVFGEFSLADFKEFEELVLYKIKFSGPVSLLVDLRQMVDFTVDVAWEEIRFSTQHAKDFDRIAVITESQWVAWSAWLSQLFVSADVRVFEDEAEAHDWLADRGE